MIWFLLSLAAVFIYHKAFAYRTTEQSLLLIAVISPLLALGLMQYVDVPGKAIGAALVISGILTLLEGNIYANTIPNLPGDNVGPTGYNGNPYTG